MLKVTVGSGSFASFYDNNMKTSKKCCKIVIVISMGNDLNLKLLGNWTVCFLTLLCAWVLFPTHVFAGMGVITILVAATLLWVANLLIRPLLQLIALPLTLITLGIFSLIVNAAMVGLASVLTPGFSIRGFGMCFVIALIITIGNTVIASGKKHKG